MKKIILVAFEFHPEWGSEAGKAHNWLKILSKHFFVEVFVHQRIKDDLEKYDYGCNVRFNYISITNPLNDLYSHLKLFNLSYRLFLKKLRPFLQKRILEGNYKLIHYITPAGIHSYNSFYRDFKIPYIVGPLGGGLPTPKGFKKAFGIWERINYILRDFFYRWLKKNQIFRKYLLNAERIIAGSEYLHDYIPQEAQQKVRIVFDTLVDLKEYQIPELIRNKEFVHIVFSGRLVVIKGISMLIDAINRLLSKNWELRSRVKVTILGDGPLYHKATKRVKQLGLDKTIIMEGRVKRKEVIYTLKDADIYCLPTIREHGGVSILEAMACRLPIITSNYGGPKYAVTENCGIKINVKNYDQFVNDLTNAIKRLVLDEQLRKNMGVNSRTRVEAEFSLEALEKKILNIYREILG